MWFISFRGGVCNKRVRPMIEVPVCLYLNIFELNVGEFMVK